ncbi:MAG: hypothetical protein RL514_2346 [Verrucomicrobiota bacterium]|jgi:ankyrin repeat protein
MKALFTLVLAAGFGLSGITLRAAEPSLAGQIAAEVERLRQELEPEFRGQGPEELEKAAQARARGVIARRLFAEGVNGGDTNKLNEAVTLDAAVGKVAYFQSAAIKGLPPIYEAVEKGNPAVVAWLLERKSPVEFTVGTILEDRDYRQYRRHLWQQPLQIAARNLRLDLMRLLLQAGASPTPVTSPSDAPSPAVLILEPFDTYRRLPTNAAVRIEAILLLQQYGADLLVGQYANQRRSPMGYALGSGQAELLDGLLTNSRPLTIHDARGNTPLHYAAALGRTNAVAALLVAGASVGAPNTQGATPLQVGEFGLDPTWEAGGVSDRPNLKITSAAQRNRVVEQLLAAGAVWDPFSHIRLGRTNELAALLKERPALIHDQFGDAGTPLHFAVQYGQRGALQLLLQHQAPVNAVDRASRTPLHNAVARDQLPAAMLLLRAGASASVPDADGNTPLHLTAAHSGGSATEILLDAKADPNQTNRLGQTALDLAAQRNLAWMVLRLTQAGAEVRAVPNGRTSLLHSAAESGDLDLLQLALARKLPVDARDAQGRTPFRCALEQGRLEVAHLLLAAGADINARDTNGATALHWCVRHGIDALPNPLPQPVFFQANTNVAVGPTPQIGAQLAGLSPILFLLERRADVTANNFTGGTPLHELLESAHYRQSRPSSTVARNIAQAMDLLMRYGAKLEAADTNGATPLHRAAQRGNLDHADILIARGADLEARDRLGRTPVMLAAQANLKAASNHLLAAGADPLARDADGNTLLHHLCATLPGTATLLTNLVNHSKFPELARLTNRFGSPPLHFALLNATVLNPPPAGPPTTNQPPPQVALLEQLLGTGPVLDFTDTNGQTYAHVLALHTTSPAYKHIESALTRIIPTRRELLDRQDRDGNTALHLATARSHLPLVELLLTRGANVNLTNHAGETPLVSGLLRYLGNSFPHQNVVQGRSSQFDPLGDLLVKHGARLDMPSKDGHTPLKLLMTDGYRRGIPASLRPKGAERDPLQALDAQDAASLRAWLRADPKLLHFRRHQHENFPTLEQEATQRPTKEIGAVLREAGAALTPFAAVAFGWSDVVRSVLSTNADFAKSEQRNRPALHWAAGSGDLDTLRAVLDAGADPQATDAAGLTALHAAHSQPAPAVVELLQTLGTHATVFDHLASGDLAALAELLARDRAFAVAETRQGQPALAVAVAAGKVELAAALLGAGADPDQDRKPKPPAVAPVPAATPAVAAAPGVVTVVRVGGFFTPFGSEPPLQTAVAAGNLPMTQLLLKHGAATDRVSSSGFTVLHQAVANANVPLVQLLLAQGAAVNAQHLPVGVVNPNAPLAGDTPLHLAARTGRTNVMEVLLRAGAKTELTNALGQTPLGAVLFPPLNAPDQAGLGEAVRPRHFMVRMGGFEPGPPKFPAARPTADFLREKGAKRAYPPSKGSWREALDPQKVQHPVAPQPLKDMAL